MMTLLVKFLFLQIIYIDKLVSFKIRYNNNRFISYLGRNLLEAIDYCTDDMYCGTVKHTACEQNNQCLTIKLPCRWVELAREDKQTILDAHNELRNKLAKGEDEKAGSSTKAANMMALSWNSDLEYVARCNLVKCSNETAHDRCKKTKKYSNVGQNIAWSMGVKNCLRRANRGVHNWYEEIESAKQIQLTRIKDGYPFEFYAETGHFTQVIWAKSAEIGCGLTIKNEDLPGKVECTLTCNYGSAGNIEGEPVFEPGEPATKCPDGLKPNSTYDGLCGEDKIDDTELEDFNTNQKTTEGTTEETTKETIAETIEETRKPKGCKCNGRGRKYSSKN